MTGTTPPILQGPTSKEKKYDRQLRLWAANGQAALEEAHILLVNSGPGVTGVETLKNLVLPGIGNFTILDSAIVDEADLGINFFLDEQTIGGFRAEHTCNLLKELNPDVQGQYITESVEAFMSRPNSLAPYTVLIVNAPLSPKTLSTISNHAATHAVPLFYLHSIGFYSHFSLQLPKSFPIVDTHPDPVTTNDLRLLTPWPTLLHLAKQKAENLEQQSDHEHGHIPYVLLLLHYLEKWKADHEGQIPSTYKEKSAFRELVRSGARMENAEGGEENFDEAVAAVLKSLNPPAVTSAVRDVFNAPECTDVTVQSPNFWLIANAISQFNSVHGVLPLPGSVPDMKAQSADYITLQNLYKTKAREDLAEVTATVRALESSLSRTEPIDDKEIEAFCKGAGYIKLIRGRPLHIARPGDLVSFGQQAKAAVNALKNPDSLILHYFAFLAYDDFMASHKSADSETAAQLPGSKDFEADAEKMIGIAYVLIDGVIKEAGMTVDEHEYSEVKEAVGKIVREIARAGGAELHNVAALTGGLVAQEVIKVVTKQYVPVDNTCLFDAISSKSSVLRV